MRNHSANQGKLTEALLLTLKHLTPIARWVFLFLIVVYFASGIRTVDPGQSALHLRFGRLLPEVHGPGIVFSLPEPLDQLVYIETEKEHALHLDQWTTSGKKIEDPDVIRRRISGQIADQKRSEEYGLFETYYIEDYGEKTTLNPVVDGYALTGDKNIVQGTFTLRYRISDPIAYFRVGDSVDELISSLLYQSMTEIISRTDVDPLLTTERDSIREKAVAQTQAKCSQLALGVEVVAVEIRTLTPPMQVITAFEDVVSAQMFAKTLYQNAVEYRTRNLTETKGQVQAIRRRAEAESAKLVASAQGEASAFSAFHAEYRLHPEMVKDRLFLDSLEYVMDQVTSNVLLSSPMSTPTIFIEPEPNFLR